MKRVGIVGYYDYSNFGDDLMALGVARQVAQGGARPLVLTQRREFDRYGFDTCAELSDFARHVDVVILGGGGALLEYHSPDPATPANQYARRLGLLAKACHQRDVPIFAVSIGGESPTVVRPLRAGIVSFLTSPTFRQATVRLQDDVACLAHLEVPASYAPDVVLAVEQMFADLREPGPIDRHGVAFQNASVEVAERAIALARRGKFPAPAFAHSTQAARDRFLREVPQSKDYEQHVINDDVIATLRFLGRMQATIGNRLHFGVAGLALGAPFYVLEPMRKTTQFFQDAGLPVPLLRFEWRPFRSGPEIHGSLADYDSLRRLPKLIEKSAAHLAFIDSCIVATHRTQAAA